MRSPPGRRGTSRCRLAAAFGSLDVLPEILRDQAQRVLLAAAAGQITRHRVEAAVEKMGMHLEAAQAARDIARRQRQQVSGRHLDMTARAGVSGLAVPGDTITSSHVRGVIEARFAIGNIQPNQLQIAKRGTGCSSSASNCTDTNHRPSR